MKPARTLLIACGALAREVAALIRANGWTNLDVRCLPAQLHNRPERIAPAVRAEIQANRERYAHMFVVYADCGTGGSLDAVLKEEGIERLPGAHCYEFLSTAQVFAQLSESEPGTFYLTDFLLRHFERLVIRPLGLDRHPELTSEYFRNYRKLVYLAQVERPGAIAQAQRIADSFGFTFEYRLTGYGELGTRLAALVDWPKSPAAISADISFDPAGQRRGSMHGGNDHLSSRALRDGPERTGFGRLPGATRLVPLR